MPFNLSAEARTWKPWLPALSVGMAAVIGFGGESRFSSPALRVPRAIAPWWVWALVFLVFGVAQLFDLPPHIEWWVRFVGAIPYCTFAVALLFSARGNPTISLTGPVVYGWIAALHLKIAAVRRIQAHNEHRKRRA